jgi:hypothetical protein
MMRFWSLTALAGWLILLSQPQGLAATSPPLRPPAVPLVTADPYLSVWSCADRLTDDVTRHWTRAEHSLVSLIRLDDQAFRLMGSDPKDVPALPQISVQVLPTRTIYEFQNPAVHVTLTFLTPALPDDLDVLSRPLTYLTWDVRTVDGKEHAVSVYYSTSSQLAVNTPDEKVAGSRPQINGLVALAIGTVDQPVLQKKGDNMRIDWGYAYTAAPGTPAAAIGADEACTTAFVRTGKLPVSDESGAPRAVSDDQPVEAMVLDFHNVGSRTKSGWLMVAYDDVYSINYFGRKLRGYWRRGGAQAADLLLKASRDYPQLVQKCAAFDDELMADLTKIGGEKYAQIGALAYRQCLAGNKLVADDNGQPLLFPKENTSNGCIATVDVIYPMDPQFLLFSPTLTKASLATDLNYAASPRWKFPFAPHDLGTYPRATGQVYGGGERTERNQMMVEESGNMIILLAALAKFEGNADSRVIWPTIPTCQSKRSRRWRRTGCCATCGAITTMDANTINSPLIWPANGSRPPTTAITSAWLSTNRAPGARSTTSSGTDCWNSICSPPTLPGRRWPFTSSTSTNTGFRWTIASPTPRPTGRSGRRRSPNRPMSLPR